MMRPAPVQPLGQQVLDISGRRMTGDCGTCSEATRCANSRDTWALKPRLLRIFLVSLDQVQ